MVMPSESPKSHLTEPSPLALSVENLGVGNEKVRPELGAQFLGQIGHLGEIAGVSVDDPLGDLTGAVRPIHMPVEEGGDLARRPADEIHA